MRQYMLNMSDSLRERLVRAATEDDCAMSEIVRRAVDEHLDKRQDRRRERLAADRMDVATK